MAKDLFLPFMEEAIKIRDELKEAYAEVDDLKTLGNLTTSCPDRIDSGGLPELPNWLLDNIVNRLEYAHDFYRELSVCRSPFIANRFVVPEKLENDIVVTDGVRASLLGKDGQPPLTGGLRVLFYILESVVASLSLLRDYVYILSSIAECIISVIISCTDKACSSGSLEFRDIYISILLFRAAYVWIKFRDVIPRGVYHRRDSNKFEPRIKFPVMKGVGGKSKRIPLGLYDTSAEAEVAYRIAAFYCSKPKHCLGRLDLGGGASFHIPVLNLDPDRPYEEKVEQVQKQVMRVYAEFEEEKARRNLLPSVRGPTLEMPTGESHVLPTSPIHQLQQALDSRMDSSMQCQGSQLSPNIPNGVNFSNPNVSLLLHMETQQKLLEAYEQIDCLKTRVSQKDFEIMQWEVKYSELEHKYSELERENELLNRQIMQSHLQPLHPEQDFDTNIFLDV